MILKETYENGVLNVDTDRIAERFLNGRPLYVQAADTEEQAGLLAFLNEEGFHSRENVPDSVYPLAIDLKNRTVSRMGSTVCAAAAVGSGLVMTGRAFFLLYSLHKAEGRSRTATDII